MALSEGTTIGPYTVSGLIGQGGMGEVYQARDTKLDRDVVAGYCRRRSRPTPTAWPGSSMKPRCSRR